ncbi:MAG: hypothetical protein BWK78_01480 [Thiotrichaceae bacterium IS1]|nr:MAG: hypothetical protein BWK78_01480 [Thiotrichaceae bacterium IS1]
MNKKKLRILHCLEKLYSGGVERRRLTLAKLLDQNQYEQKIICTEARGPLADEIRSHGVEIIQELPFNSIFDWKRYQRGAKFMRDWQPDIVHGAVFEGCAMAAVAGRLARRPIILTEETSDPQNRSWRGHLLYRAIVSLADYAVAVSPAVGTYLNEKIKVPRKKIRVITNGVIPPRIPNPAEIHAKRDELGLPKDAFVVGSVGRVFNSPKRFSDLIEAVAILKVSCPNLYLLIVGDGPDKSMLERLAEQLGMQNRVIFTGYQYDTGLIYALMDVFALVSEYEAFGLVLVEAMFCGLPIVTSGEGGMKNIVVNNETGVFVPKRNVQAIATALQNLYFDKPLGKQMGEAGRLRAQEHFSAERYVKDVDEFYQFLAKKYGVFK